MSVIDVLVGDSSCFDVLILFHHQLGPIYLECFNSNLIGDFIQSIAMSYDYFYRHGIASILRQVRKIKRNNEAKYYAVAVGRRIGIYRHWASCKVQIDGIANAKYRRFNDHEQALKYMTEIPKEIPIPEQAFLIPHPKVKKEAIVYTDGACLRNGMPNASGGLGVYWPSMPQHNISTRFEGKQTSIRAELQAVITAIRQAKQLGVECLTIYTDSHFVIQCAVAWLPKWKKNGWIASKGASVKNREDLEELDRAMSAMKQIIWKAVPAHTGVKGNEEADKLANMAVVKYESETNETKDEKANQQESSL